MKPRKRRSDYCTLYIVRHGETEWNTKGWVQGHTDIPLNANGLRQAKDLYKKLKYIRFSSIFSSDLLRAKQTAGVIALEHKLAIQTTKALRERWFGEYEGHHFSKMEDAYDRLIKKYKDVSRTYREMKVEHNEALMNRLIPFLRETAMRYAGKNILMVSHGGAMRVFLIHLGWATYEELPAGSIDNLAYVKLRCDGVDFFVDQVEGIHKKMVP